MIYPNESQNRVFQFADTTNFVVAIMLFGMTQELQSYEDITSPAK